jgi:hypothetical protein
MLWPALLLDSTGTVAGVVNRANGEKSLVLYDIVWSWETQSKAMTAQFAPRRQITSPKAQPVYDLVDADWATDIYQLPTQPVPGGVRVVLNGKDQGELWRLLSASAQPLVDSDLQKDWTMLEPAQGRDLCARHTGILKQRQDNNLAEQAKREPEIKDYIYTAQALRDPKQGLCLVVQTFDRRQLKTGDPVLPTAEVTVGLYYESALEAAYGQAGDQKAAFPVVPAASAMFTKQAPAVQWKWWQGTKGERAGWLAAQPTAQADQMPQLSGNAVLAMPLDLQALVNQAQEVLSDEKLSPSTSSTPVPPKPAPLAPTESRR